MDHRESGAAPRHRRDGREILQDQRALLLRAVAQFMQGSPDADLGAVIFDVTGFPIRRR
jgi:hypothetical protein